MVPSNIAEDEFQDYPMPILDFISNFHNQKDDSVSSSTVLFSYEILNCYYM